MFGLKKDAPVRAGRIPMMAGNWKANKATAEAVRLTQELIFAYDSKWEGRVDVVICPPLIDLKPVSNALTFDKSPIVLGAQNVCRYGEGAYTGEVSARMLKEVRCEYCIVGHSERREYFHETDADVNAKALALIEQGIKPIICCGEKLETREAGETLNFVLPQISAAFEGISAEDAVRCVVAYEPIWAIGTGRVPTPEAADEVCGAIRGRIAELYGQDVADKIRILYGGSMKPENVNQFLPMPNIDGGLIGGAALKADSFAALASACC